MSPTRNKIALLVESSRAYGRGLLRGIAHYSHTRANWFLLHQEMTIDTKLPSWLKNSGISGVIARVDEHNVDNLRDLKLPIVDVRCSVDYPDIPRVETDDRAVARLAFQHLWERDFRRFAFCGFQFAHFSEARLRHFREFVENAGAPLSIYQSPGEHGALLTDLEQSGLEDFKELSKWLKSLEAPTGLLVCNDIRGQHVLNTCQSLKISVPDDTSIIGVDNDEAICLLSNPPLSSVIPDSEAVGFRAAETLQLLMNGENDFNPIEYIQPRGVSQRLSTHVHAVEDREIARVCRYIRENACEGINVADVVRYSMLSRRQLERRFRSLLNKTPHEQITEVQVERVKQLLTETSMTLDQLSELTGYSHKERLSAVFKRETGITPGEHRRLNTASS
ncbi:MAG: AraC family transcriptional regulator [Blastopirellula sp.]|nr:MAG: AraC family transcriptional regulator [Blastopirellula sp.]